MTHAKVSVHLVDVEQCIRIILFLQTLMNVQLVVIPVTEMPCAQILKAVSTVPVIPVSLVMGIHAVSRQIPSEFLFSTCVSVCHLFSM